MSIPGFTAEASLYIGNVRYQGPAGITTFHDGIVPAIVSEYATLEGPSRYGLARRFGRWGNCLKPTCQTVLIKDKYGQIVDVMYVCGAPWRIAIC